MNDDATLVELAQSGDQAAFAELYERYFDRVYDFLARMVHDSSEAADLTQDAFLKAMNSLGSLTKGTSFKSWLFTIARNTALNRLERASRTQPLEGTDDAGDEQHYDVIDEDRYGNPEEAAEASDLASVVWEAAAALDPKYRSVLLLNLREGLDSAEIADVMGVTKNHAYVLVNRMKSALESAVGAVALFRNGRRHCAELDAVVNRLQIGELTPEARRVIERHAGSCATCKEQRSRLSSPFAIIAGLALVQPATGIKESIFGSLEAAFSALPSGGAGSTGGAGASGGGFESSGDPGPGNGAGSQDSGGASGGNGNAGDGPSSSAGQTAGGQPGASETNGNSGTGHHANAPANPDSGVAGVPAGTNATASTSSTGGPVPPVVPALAGEGDEKHGGRKRAIALGLLAALLLLVGGPIAAIAFFDGGDTAGEAGVAVVQATATASPTASPPATASPPPTATGTPTELAQAALVTETPTPDPGTPVPIEPGPAGPSIAPGGGEPSGAEPPGGVAPPGITPGTGDGPSGGGGELSPTDPDAGGSPDGDGGPGEGTAPETDPDPPGITPEPPGITPEPPGITPEPPCTQSLSASPASLEFGPRSTRQTVTLKAEGCGSPLPFTATPGAAWIFVIPSSGSVPDGGSASVIVEVALADAETSGRVRIQSAAGAIDIPLKVAVPTPTPLPLRGSDPDPCGVNCPKPTNTPLSLRN